MNASFGSCHDDISMLIQPPWPNPNDMRLDLIEHLAVIGKCLRSVQSLRGIGATFFVGVRNRDQFANRDLAPNGVDSMAVIPATGVTNDCDAKLIRHDSGSWKGISN
jgi:hypothetical protein